jgi:hypothetical protein
MLDNAVLQSAIRRSAAGTRNPSQLKPELKTSDEHSTPQFKSQAAASKLRLTPCRGVLAALRRVELTIHNEIEAIVGKLI